MPNKDLVIVVTGNPVDGFEFHGPFSDVAEADEWAEGRFADSYWCSQLEKPE